MNTIAKACCHVNPSPNTTVNVKNAFNPIPGACANGTFATNPITRVPIAAAIIVATKTAFLSIPAAAKIDGFTNKIYAIVRNVVNPAINSVLTSVPFSLSLKNLSIIAPF